MKTDCLLNREVDHVLALLTPQNALIMRVALHTGLRIGDILVFESAKLKPHFWITERKTGKRRQVGLPEPLLSDIMRQAGEFWAFPGRLPGKHKTRQALWKDVKRAAKALRLPQNVAPHSMRKSYAVDLMHKYGNIERVRRSLNHSSVAVTIIYALADIQMGQKKRRRTSTGNKKA